VLSLCKVRVLAVLDAAREFRHFALCLQRHEYQSKDEAEIGSGFLCEVRTELCGLVLPLVVAERLPVPFVTAIAPFRYQSIHQLDEFLAVPRRTSSQNRRFYEVA